MLKDTAYTFFSLAEWDNPDPATILQVIFLH